MAGAYQGPDDRLIAALSACVGADHVLTDMDSRTRLSRDRMPYGLFRGRGGDWPGCPAIAVVRPADAGEVSAVVRVAAETCVPVIARGEGSGVLGGAVPIGLAMVIDLTRMNRILSLQDQDGLVTVEAGMNGLEFEDALNARGWTCGHFPSSMDISTVGGWVACRGAGQASTRYGKIEDMVAGLRAVLPDGQILDIRPAPRRSVGPSLQDLIVGSEGTLAIITEVTLRIWRKPALELGEVLLFPDLPVALTALRDMLQSGLRPAVARIYDPQESRWRSKDHPGLASHPVLCLLEFHGSAEMVEAEARLALAGAAIAGARQIDDTTWRNWRQTRYQSLSRDWQARGYFMDTVEVACPWSALPAMYDAMRDAVLAVHPEVHFGAHWSHAYADGVCQYMTLRLPPMENELGIALHARIWDRLQMLALEHQAAIAHHHGAGLFRNPWIAHDLGAPGMQMLQAIKDAVDPANLFNPGKLGLRASPSVV